MQSQTINKLGFHYPTHSHQQTLKDLHNWLEQVKDLPASWVLVHGTSDRAVPEPFLKGLMDAGLEPIVHIPCQIGAIRPDKIHPLLYSYAHWGLKQVIVYDKPNIKKSWADNGWATTNLTERFVDASLPTLQAAFSAGLVPTLAPLEPGGDYWDTAFLKSALKAIARRGQKELVDALVISAYAPTSQHGLDWGKGGPAAWPAARPYFTPDNSEDHRGFHIFDWYRAIATEVLGKPRPVLALQTSTQGQQEVDEAKDSAIAQRITKASASAGLMAFLFDQVPSADVRTKWQEFASPGEAKSTAPIEPSTGKRLSHYLLLPDHEATAVPIWRRASAFALTHQPVVGFSVEEACLAQRVTIAADFEAIPAEVDQKLRATGCQVERLSLLPQKKSACQNRCETKRV